MADIVDSHCEVLVAFSIGASCDQQHFAADHVVELRIRLFEKFIENATDGNARHAEVRDFDFIEIYAVIVHRSRINQNIQVVTLLLGLLLILLINQVLVQLIFFLRSNISGLGHYRVDSMLSSLDKLLMLITCGVLLWVTPFGISVSVESFALAQTLALVPTALSAVGSQLYKSLELRDTTANAKFPIANPHQGKFRVEVSRYLGNAQYTGNSAKAW